MTHVDYAALFKAVLDAIPAGETLSKIELDTSVRISRWSENYPEPHALQGIARWHVETIGPVASLPVTDRPLRRVASAVTVPEPALACKQWEAFLDAATGTMKLELVGYEFAG